MIVVDITSIAVGFLSGVILTLISLFGNRLLEGVRLKNSKYLKFSESQSKIYHDIWGSLYDLKKSGDCLWKKASIKNLEDFKKQKDIVEDMIGRNQPFIEANHINRLQELMEQFEFYIIGKNRLVKARSESEEQNRLIQDKVDSNEEIKHQYETLLQDINSSFGKQVRRVKQD